MKLKRRVQAARRVVRGAIEYWVDMRRYLAHSTPDRVESTSAPRHQECQVTKDYHAIEKAFALPATKRPFGAAPRARLAMLLGGESGASYISYGAEARDAVDRWNQVGAPDGVIDDLVSARDAAGPLVRPYSSSPIAEFQAESFLRSRSSLRHYDTDRVVPLSEIEEAVVTATYSPSVCNRQAWRAHVFTESASKAAILGTQFGNRGFGAYAPVVLAITADLRLFQGVGERSQAWVDGGLFSMMLSLALHARGLGSCMLNMANLNKQSDRAREIIGVGPEHVVIMLMTVGYAATDAVVARSPRRSPHEAMSIVGSPQ